MVAGGPVCISPIDRTVASPCLNHRDWSVTILCSLRNVIFKKSDSDNSSVLYEKYSAPLLLKIDRVWKNVRRSAKQIKSIIHSYLKPQNVIAEETRRTESQRVTSLRTECSGHLETF